MVDRDSCAQLFRALTTTDVRSLVARAADAGAIGAALQPLRDRSAVTIVSLAINGPRVDVVARADEEEWRIVFATTDGARVEWLSVFERPAGCDGLPGGTAVIVNGPSSAGKSSVLRELQSRNSVPWVVFDEPMFGAVNVEYLIWRERAEGLHRGFLDGIAALARAGNRVAVAAGGHPRSWFDAAFAGVPTISVGLDCAVAELVRRERCRADVAGGLAEASLDVHDGWRYDLRFDTTISAPGEIAAAILSVVRR